MTRRAYADGVGNRRQTPRSPAGRRLAAGGVALVVGAVAWLAGRPGAPPGAGPAVKFVDVTAAAGIAFTHTSGAAGRKLLPETMAGGVAVIDYDADGRPDLFFVNAGPWPGDGAGPPPTSALYRNQGDGTFRDVTAETGLAVPLFGLGVAVGDFDNDGFADLFVAGVGGNRLFHNVPAGAGRGFTDVTAAAGVGGGPGVPGASRAAFERHADPVAFPASAAVVDFDGDGRPDLFVCHYLTWSPAADLATRAVLADGSRGYVPPTQFPGAQCVLYRNLGGGHFADVSAAAGVRVTEAGAAVGKALGVTVCDPDHDGWPDLLVACDTARNLYFHNVPGPAGSRVYDECAVAAGLAFAETGGPRGGMGIDTADLTPGRFAAVVANFSDEPSSLFEPTDPAGRRFRDVARRTRLAGRTRTPMKFGTLLADFDGDGRPDLVNCNGHLEPDVAAGRPGQTYAQSPQLFWNTGDPADLFRPADPAAAGPDLFRPLVGRGCAVLDFDGDGDPDLVLAANGGPPRLLRADNATGNRWLRLALAGDGAAVNRDATGATVAVEVGGETTRHFVTAARGYLSQSELTLSVGLGRADRADAVTVTWPGGRVEAFGAVAAGAHRLAAGAGR